MSALPSAVASGNLPRVKHLVEEAKTDMDAVGADGTTALCAAALWGNDVMVQYLLKHGASVDARNKGSEWTALHAATFQEHGKIVRSLLEFGADINARDVKSRTPIDYATISQAIWPFFDAKGAVRTKKAALVSKGIIRKVEADKEGKRPSSREKISHLSRPGSSYRRTSYNPFAPFEGSAPSAGGARGAGRPPLPTVAVDPLAEDDSPTGKRGAGGFRGIH